MKKIVIVMAILLLTPALFAKTKIKLICDEVIKSTDESISSTLEINIKKRSRIKASIGGTISSRMKYEQIYVEYSNQVVSDLRGGFKVVKKAKEGNKYLFISKSIERSSLTDKEGFGVKSEVYIVDVDALELVYTEGYRSHEDKDAGLPFNKELSYTLKCRESDD